MSKINCWEYKKCGREPNGAKSKDLGVCPASIQTKLDNVNHGKNGGRACWPIAGTLCGGKVQGSFAVKVGNCLKCDFYQLVKNEEADLFVTSKDILNMLQVH